MCEQKYAARVVMQAMLRLQPALNIAWEPFNAIWFDQPEA
jgi:hypothetical protein